MPWSRLGAGLGPGLGPVCRPSGCVTGACLCRSPCSTPWSLSRGRRPPAPSVSSDSRWGEGRKEEEQRSCWRRLPPAHHVSVRGEARTRAPLGEMVRCCQRPPNPAVPRHNLHKVRVHVQRPRSGGGSGGPGAPPRLEGPGLGGLSRRARFRYCEGGAGWRPRVCAALNCGAPTPFGCSSSTIGPVLLQ